jgi:hypothetical protein
MPTAFLLLRGLDLGLGPVHSRDAVARESEAPLERMCGTSCDPGCGALLLYSRARLFELSF